MPNCWASMRRTHSRSADIAIIVVTQGSIFALCRRSIAIASHNRRSITMMTQPIQMFENLTSETSPAGGNAHYQDGLYRRRPPVDRMRARYAARRGGRRNPDRRPPVGGPAGTAASSAGDQSRLQAARAEAQLLRMSDRELADLGLSRADIHFAVRETAEGVMPQFERSPTCSAGEPERAPRSVSDSSVSSVSVSVRGPAKAGPFHLPMTRRVRAHCRDRRRARRRIGRRLIEFPQEAQFDERLGIEIDPQVDERKAFLVHDEESGGLELLQFTAGSIAGFDRRA